MTILTFEHLINEPLFDSLKKEFLMGDMKYRDSKFHGNNFEVDLSQEEITVFKEKAILRDNSKSKSFDPNLNEETEDEVYDIQVEEVTLNFKMDFLIPKIMELTETYKKVFEKEIRKRNLYSNSQIENFSKIGLNRLNSKKSEISAAMHLEDSVKEAAINSIDEIYDFLSDGYYHTYISIPNRIPFVLTKNQVVGLFHFLYENELISHEIKRNELFNLIDVKCSFYDKKSNSYKGIRQANKLWRSLFGPNPDKSSKATIDELQEIFNHDFFSV